MCEEKAVLDQVIESQPTDPTIYEIIVSNHEYIPADKQYYEMHTVCFGPDEEVSFAEYSYPYIRMALVTLMHYQKT